MVRAAQHVEDLGAVNRLGNQIGDAFGQQLPHRRWTEIARPGQIGTARLGAQRPGRGHVFAIVEIDLEQQDAADRFTAKAAGAPRLEAPDP